MQIALLFESKEINHFFYFSLMQEGHEIKGFTDVPSLLEFLEGNECELAVLDMDLKEVGGESVLAKVRMVSEKVQIVTVTMVTSFMIKDILTKYRVFGIIPKPVSFPKLLEEIHYYIDRIGKNPPRSKRKYPRFSVGKMHNVIKVTLSDLNTSYIGKVQDLSMGGMGVNLKNEASPYVIFPGKKIQCQVELKNISFPFQGKVANFNGEKRLGILFDEVNPHDIKKVKDFILDIMLEENTDKE
jgi:CheY-like chemotaxis protein